MITGNNFRISSIGSNNNQVISNPNEGMVDYEMTSTDEKDKSYNIHIKKSDEILPWKKFNSHMAISIEYDLEY